MSKLIWMVVTADKYELPMCVADSCTELAMRWGTTRAAIATAVTRNVSGRNKGYKYIRVEVD